MSDRKARIAVLVSGGGTNLQAIIDATRSGIIKSGEVVAVISSRADAFALERAKNAGIPGMFVSKKECGSQKKFEEKIKNIGELLKSIEPYEKNRTEKIRQRLVDSLSQIPDVEYDKNRLEQEMIYYIEKLDINEEKQRLANHLKYFLETMNENKQGQGKKLGFIAQEMGREINTTGSKSNQAEMQNIVVKMKDELEQIKEQVLNVM